MSALVHLCLEYCNTVPLIFLPQHWHLYKQRVLNAAARAVFNHKPHDLLTPYLKELYWLPITARVDYRLCPLACKKLLGHMPLWVYLCLLPAFQHDLQCVHQWMSCHRQIKGSAKELLWSLHCLHETDVWQNLDSCTVLQLVGIDFGHFYFSHHMECTRANCIICYWPSSRQHSIQIKQSVNLYIAKVLKVVRVWSTLMSNQLKTVLNRCVFSSVLKLVRDEADCTLLGWEVRAFGLFGAHNIHYCSYYG